MQTLLYLYLLIVTRYWVFFLYIIHIIWFVNSFQKIYWIRQRLIILSTKNHENILYDVIDFKNISNNHLLRILSNHSNTSSAKSVSYSISPTNKTSYSSQLVPMRFSVEVWLTSILLLFPFSFAASILTEKKTIQY